MHGVRAHGRTGRKVTAFAAAVVLVTLSGCSSDTAAIEPLSPDSWPASHANAHNSGSTAVSVDSPLTLDWTRPTGGTVSSPVSIGSTGQMFVTAATESGCNLFSFEIDSARKRWCNRVGPSVVTATPTVDSAINVYIGDDGGMNSYNDHGQLRWRTPVYGVPKSAQFLGDGSVLSVTQMGQVSVLDTQNGQLRVPILDLVPTPNFLTDPNSDFQPVDTGLAECSAGGSECVVPAAPAVDTATGAIYLTLWRPGSIAPQLVSLQYNRDGSPGLTERWSSDLLPAGVASSPVLSEDGSTVYVADVDGRLTAFDTADGRQKWTEGTGLGVGASPSIAADGTIVPAGGDGTLVGLRDNGDSVERVWVRDDIEQAGTAAQSADGRGHTVVRDGDGLALLTFDSATGNTVDSQPVPDVVGGTVGTSIGPDGQVVTASYLGEIFTYTG
ncbi:cell surface protein [Rhodococcus sp. 15-649-2-2]|uniref:outer membrane protein assembly factor BamB family protein n=1 Tax=Rhodococcus sp. 15-649-2-2 TaxID=2023140 RepID=UPI000B9B6DD1|nr:PQQ-binding-like beta-propeller repeat protein [Rhodococcus sp. 15-649-2-2]OZE74721.1 cell surface protein [Rhodococcus sp. 15-649-2-2]